MQANLSSAEILQTNIDNSVFDNTIWKFTKFKNTNFNKIIFNGTFADCHFEHCSFYGVKFENATILNTFFKYNEKFKKVQFVNCQVDNITFAFLKNNQANMTGITVV